jgi:hypothetical protein
MNGRYKRMSNTATTPWPLQPKAGSLGLRELQLQSWGGSAAALLSVALKLQDLRAAHCPATTLTIKLPCTAEGLEAATELRRQRPDSSITVTGVYAAHQVNAYVPQCACLVCVLLLTAV